MRSRQVVFNADDLGASCGVNEAIQASVDAGLVREMSLMVTMAHAEEGARVAKTVRDRAGVGLHFTLTAGRPLTSALPLLTDRSGRFRRRSRVLLSSALGRLGRSDVERELRAQLARFRELGLEPSHLNGHEHVHAFPQIRSVVLDIARELGLAHVRTPRVSLRKLSPRAGVIELLGRGLVTENDRSGRPVPTLPLVGIGLYNRRGHRARFLRAAQGIKPGCAEWLVHPRFDDESFEGEVGEGRGVLAPNLEEVRTLTDPQVVLAIRAMGIEPVRYAALHGVTR